MKSSKAVVCLMLMHATKHPLSMQCGIKNCILVSFQTQQLSIAHPVNQEIIL